MQENVLLKQSSPPSPLKRRSRGYIRFRTTVQIWHLGSVFLIIYLNVQWSFSRFIKNLLEQWSLTGGRQSSLAMSVFLIFSASSTYRTKARHRQVIGRTCKALYLFPFHQCCTNSPTSPSPTLWQESWMRWLIRSQTSWTLHQLSCHFHPPGSEDNTQSNLVVRWDVTRSRLWPRPHLKFHYIAAGWCAHQSGPHILGVFVQSSHIPGVFIVVHHLEQRDKPKMTRHCLAV